MAYHAWAWGQALVQIDQCMRIRIGARGVIQIQVLAIGEAYPPKRHPVDVDLRAARNGAGGHRRIDNDLSHHKPPYRSEICVSPGVPVAVWWAPRSRLARRHPTRS